VPTGSGLDGFGDWQQVAETAQLYEARLIALRLQAAGIRAEVVDQSFRQEPLPNVRSFAVVRVLVPAVAAERARQVLSRDSSQPEDVEEIPAAGDGAGADPGGT